MSRRAWAAIFLLGILGSASVANAQSQGQNQGHPMAGTPVTPVGGMEMGHGIAMQEGMKMEMGKSTPFAGPLTITFGAKHAEWTLAALAALPHTTLTLFNEHAKANQTYSGVPLIELLKPLGVPEKPHGKEFRLYLVSEGADGYQVVYSVAEVTPDVHDGTVLVADTQDGKPIVEDGALKIVATGEKRPARWVRNLAAIRVMQAQ